MTSKEKSSAEITLPNAPPLEDRGSENHGGEKREEAIREKGERTSPEASAALSTAASSSSPASGSAPSSSAATVTAAAAPAASAEPAPDAIQVWKAVAANWLLPGAGFFMLGERRRALVLGVLLNGLFVAGILLKGSVIFPEFNPASQTFNVISVLTFFVSFGNAAPSAACLVSRYVGDESSATFELATFHLLLAGALNYFACCALYDRFRPKPDEAGKDTRKRPQKA